MSRAYFDAVADAWDGMRKGFYSEAVRERAADAVGVAPGMAALDVGAGSGFVSEELLRRGARVTAVDASRPMLDALARRLPGVKVRHADAEALPFADGSFDRVFANMVLHHVEDPARAVAEWSRVLRPGGALAITDLDAHGHEFLRVEQHDRWLGFEREDVAGWYDAAGLSSVRVEGVGDECCASSDCGTESAKVTIFLATGRRP